MIPFPGESLSVDSYENRAGDPIDSRAQIATREGAAFFGTGAAAVVRVFFGPQYLETDTDPGEVSWVVEVAGGSGSLTLTECLGDGEPDTLLGTFPVEAGDTLVVPSTVITLANVWNDFYGSLLIEATTGPLNIQQVKLRAFPTGGALGGWGADWHDPWDRPAYPTGRDVQGVRSGTVERSSPLGIEANWAAAGAFMPDASAGTPSTLTVGGAVTISGDRQESVTLFANSSSIVGDEGSAAGAFLFESATALHRATPYPDVNPAGGLTEGVDYIANPYEVPGDVGSYAYSDGVGTNTWDPDVFVTWDYELGVVEVPPLIGAIPFDVASAEATDEHLWPDAEAVPPALLTMPEDDDVLVAGSHGWFRDAAPETPGVDQPLDYTVEMRSGFTWALRKVDGSPGVSYTAHLPRYKVWVVTTATARPMRLMQRGDSLGMGSGRVLGVGTRQGGVKVLGSY